MNCIRYRRRFMAQAAIFSMLPLMTWRQAGAQTTAVDAMIAKITGGAPLQSGRVRLQIPVLADNGNSVSLRVSVDSPMSADERVKSIHIFAPRNPRPNVANYFFGPAAGRAQVSTRIRLSGSQGVVAIAALSDGSFWTTTADVAVTVSACWDAS